MKTWTKTKTHSEGKFLVVRRDGTTPDWPHFVLGARDPAAPLALTVYAQTASILGYDSEYVASIRQLADDFRTYESENGKGDPDAPPHRVDDPVVLSIMRRELSVYTLIVALRMIAAGFGDAQEIAKGILTSIHPSGSKTPEAKP